MQRRRVEISRRVALPGIARACHQRVELDPRLGERLEPADGRDQRSRPARLERRGAVARGEVDGVGLAELAPRQRIVPSRPHPFADHRDRPLPALVDVHEAAPLGVRAKGGLDAQAEPLQLALCTVAELVVAECGVERGRSRQLAELDGGHRTAAPGLLPGLAHVDDLAGRRHMVDAAKLDPLDMSHHGCAHAAQSLRHPISPALRKEDRNCGRTQPSEKQRVRQSHDRHHSDSPRTGLPPARGRHSRGNDDRPLPLRP